ncbi:MAG: hypothetical protein QNJ18_12385 [Xenococcaceae cyanobacterium MO_167.B52]|nr:hypothetical protein [Xenococcaceae cyanobacterium MO_167.B52]
MESEQSRKQSLSQTETVKEQLRKTNEQLEGVIEELNKITVQQLPESSSLETLIQTTEELEGMISQAQNSIENPVIAAEKAADTVQETKLPQEESSEKSALTITSKTAKVPKFQPQRLLIIGIAAAIAISLMQIGLQFLPAQSQAIAETAPPEIAAEQPVVKKEVEKTIEPKSEPKKTLIPEEIMITETGSERRTEIQLIEPTQTTSKKPPEVEVVTPEVKPEEKPPEVKVVTPEVKPEEKPPEVKVVTPTVPSTPEQKLIAAIEQRIAKIATSYEPELLTAIEADLKSSKLSITLDDQWYQTKSDRQDKIAYEILKRSRQLAFEKLIIQDKDGKLLARNPVVGNRMVILERNNEQ